MKNSEIVKKSYTKIAKKYHEQRHLYPNKSLLIKFKKYVKKGAKVLDLGCGAGVPISKFLINKGFQVTGIDFADGMLKLAKKNVPKAKFFKMDMTKMNFKQNSFDGAVSFYAIIHVPREKHTRIYRSLHKILNPNAVMILNAAGNCEWEGTAENYMGVPMFWSFYHPNKTLKIIENEGFEIIWNKILHLGNEDQFWVLARNKK